MCVHVCVCVCAVCVDVVAWLCVCVHVCVWACVCACVCVCMCVCVQVHHNVVQLVFSVTFSLSCTMFELIIFEILGIMDSRYVGRDGWQCDNNNSYISAMPHKHYAHNIYKYIYMALYINYQRRHDNQKRTSTVSAYINTQAFHTQAPTI